MTLKQDKNQFNLKRQPQFFTVTYKKTTTKKKKKPNERKTVT